MSSSASVRHRGSQNPKKAQAPPPPPPARDTDLNGSIKDNKQHSAITSEWDFKAALAVITALAFLTRFWGIGHPNEVVFDEVHFGKVSPSRTRVGGCRLFCGDHQRSFGY